MSKKQTCPRCGATQSHAWFHITDGKSFSGEFCDNCSPDLENRVVKIDLLSELMSAALSDQSLAEEEASKTKSISGGLNNYYLVNVASPQRAEQPPYQAECEDIIRSLNMTFDEGCEFKAIWRTAAARMGNGKPGQSAIYDAEKRVHYAQAALKALQGSQGK